MVALWVVGPGGCGGELQTVDAAAAATVAVDKLAPSFAAGLLACLFSSSCTDGCSVLMCLCRLFVEHATCERAYSALNFTAFPAVTHFLTFPACCLCSVCSLSLSLSLSLYVEKLLSHCLSRCLSSCLSACPSSCLSSHLSYQLFIIFLPEKQRLSPAKDFNSQSVSDENKAL